MDNRRMSCWTSGGDSQEATGLDTLNDDPAGK